MVGMDLGVRLVGVTKFAIVFCTLQLYPLKTWRGGRGRRRVRGGGVGGRRRVRGGGVRDGRGERGTVYMYAL